MTAPGRAWLNRFRANPTPKQPSNVTVYGLTAGISAQGWPASKPLQPFSWKTVGRISVKGKISWNLHSPVVARTHAIEWRTTDHVTNSIAVSWNLDKRLFKQLDVRFQDFYKVRAFTLGGIRFDVYFRFPVQIAKLISSSPGDIDTSVVHPIVFSTPAATLPAGKTIDNPLVRPLSYQFYPDAGMIPTAGITWRTGLDPAGRVVCRLQCSFNDMISAKAQRKLGWGTVGRWADQLPVLFNVYVDAKNDIIMEWVVGPPIPGRIRQLAQSRMDFIY